MVGAFLSPSLAFIARSYAQGSAQTASPDDFDKANFAGDLRAGYARNKRRERDKSESTTYMPTLRMRYGFVSALTPNLEMNARLAGLFNKDTDAISLRAQGPIASGDITIDSLFLHFKPLPSVSINVGRLQTAFELASVIEDSLSRHDSSGTAVDWTNGIHTVVGNEDSYRIHFIAQANRKSGPTNAVGTAGPVSFEDRNSRVTYYFGLQLPSSETLTQLVADITVIPGALRPLGFEQNQSSSIVAATLKTVANFGLGEKTVRPFLEMGATLVDTHREIQNTSGIVKPAGRWAVVTGFDILDVGFGDLGIQAAWVESGFIISPDYPPNAFSVEVRHRTRIGENAVFDIRYRHREDIRKTIHQAARVDQNVQARFTMSF